MAVAGNSAPALRIRWHNKTHRVIAITQTENRPSDVIEDSANDALVILEHDGIAWIRATHANELRSRGYIVRPIEHLRLHPI